jgi:hypothetical protein
MTKYFFFTGNRKALNYCKKDFGIGLMGALSREKCDKLDQII